mgnify:CR=1 FL=1
MGETENTIISDTEFQSYRERLNETVDCGGCPEMWDRTEQLRKKRGATAQDTPDTGRSRRAILQLAGTAGASAAIAGMSGPARAKSMNHPQVVWDRATDSSVEAAVEPFKDTLLRELSEQGFVDEPTASGLDFDEIHPVMDGYREDAVTVRLDQPPESSSEPDHLSFHTRVPADEFDDGLLTIALRPEVGRATAAGIRDGDVYVLYDGESEFEFYSTAVEFADMCDCSRDSSCPCYNCMESSGGKGNCVDVTIEGSCECWTNCSCW